MISDAIRQDSAAAKPPERARASHYLVCAYANADKLSDARAIYDDMAVLDETEAIRMLRARASFALALGYHKAGGSANSSKLLAETMQYYDEDEEKFILDFKKTGLIE
jgi:hypothetical protein